MSDDGAPFDSRSFRRALGRFATGVCIVTTVSPDGDPLGLTVNSFTSVSLNPPLILWCLARSSSNRHVYETASHFAVGILAEDQRDLALLFAREADDRFAGLDWRWNEQRVPIIAGNAATLHCRRHDRFDGGDHLIIVGEVVQLEDSDRPPLVFHLGDFGGFKG